MCTSSSIASEQTLEVEQPKENGYTSLDNTNSLAVLAGLY